MHNRSILCDDTTTEYIYTYVFVSFFKDINFHLSKNQMKVWPHVFQHFIPKMDSTLSVFGRYYSKKRGREVDCNEIRLKITDSQVLPQRKVEPSLPQVYSPPLLILIPPRFSAGRQQLLNLPYLFGNNYSNYYSFDID